MKGKCNVVRDLMPLVIDQACSEESAAFVEAHVAECPPCAEVYGAMKAELPRQAAEKERAEAEAAAKALQKQRKRRRRKLVLLGLAVGIVLALAVNAAYTMLFQQAIYPMSSEEYTVSLYRTSEDKVLAVYRVNQEDMTCGFSRGGDGKTLNIKASRTIAQFGNERVEQLYGGWYIDEIGVWTEDGWAAAPYLLPRYSKGKDGMELISEEDRKVIPEPYEAVYVAYSDGHKLIYQKGDDIPLASEALELYIAPGMYNDPEERAQQRDFIPEFH